METKAIDYGTRREIISWAMFDFANSSYTTVVTTAIFNAYFVKTICQGLDLATATFYLALANGLANGLVVLTAPVIGAIADRRGLKKRFLFIATLICVTATIGLSFMHQGMVVASIGCLVIAGFAFGTSEDIIAAFLPEIAPRHKMGRISAFGWTLGYVGGLIVLAACLAYVSWAQSVGQTASQFVPVTMLIVAGVFMCGATPTFLFLRERKSGEMPATAPHPVSIIELVKASREHKDLFTFFIALLLYSCGSTTVVMLAAVYSEQVMQFKTSETIGLVMAVNVAGALGAMFFGYLQDAFGSVRTLAATLVLWVVSILLAICAGPQDRALFWTAAALMGLSMGSSASAGRALVGMLAPQGRSAEFFGLWGLVVKASAIIGPLTYSAATFLSHSNYRVSLVSTVIFFISGLIMCLQVNEKRGRANAAPLLDL
jgi:MFS transporter, UMF1 family